ncbi:MAG: hypothetical protein ACK5JP_05705 [Akkermansiaceae bacterium]|jgi:hypothetical protein
MKKVCGLFFFGFAVMSASADDIEKRRAEETGKKFKEYQTVSGQVYRDVTITKITDAVISITHADGLARLRFEHLKPDQRKEFGITQEGAEAIYTMEMKAKTAYEVEVLAKQREQQKANEELLATQTIALLEAERLAAIRVQKQQVATKIESTMEIPVFPNIRGSNNSVLYPTQRYSPSQKAIYCGSGGYVYPTSYGGYYYSHGNGGYYNPGHHHHYSPTRPSCPTNQRNSIFSIRIK